MILDQPFTFFEANHPHGWIEEELVRFDDQLRLIYDRADDRWKVVRRTQTLMQLEMGEGERLSYLQHHWAIVRVCQWDNREPRKPGQWILHSLFDGRLQVKTPEEATRYVRALRKKEFDRKRKKRERLSKQVEEIAHDHFPSMGRAITSG